MNRTFFIIGLLATMLVIGVVLGPSISSRSLTAQVGPPGGGGPPGNPPVASGWTDDGTVVRLTTETDQVGIGTVGPVEKLDVVGNINITGNITIGGLVDSFDISAKAPDWDLAFLERRQWNGVSANLNPSLGRSSLGLGSLSTLDSVSGGVSWNNCG